MRQKNPKAASFKNKSFVHYNRMTELIPERVLGTHVFRPSTGVRGAAALTSGRPTPPEASGMLPPSAEGGDDSDSSGAHHPPVTPEGAHQSPSISSSAHSSKRKFSALDSVSHRSSSQNTSMSSKKPRSSSAIALQMTNANLSSLTDAVQILADARKRKADSRHAGSPERRERAAVLLQEQEHYLSSDAMIALLDLIQDNTKFADTYLTLKRLDWRVTWVLKRLDVELNFQMESVLEPGVEETLSEDIRVAITAYMTRHAQPE